jgi:hypothetical protein
LVSDATATFNKKGLNGQKNFSAELIHETALASLNGEFVTLVTIDFLNKIFRHSVEEKRTHNTGLTEVAV